jgi:hypothetical protein
MAGVSAANLNVEIDHLFHNEYSDAHPHGAAAQDEFAGLRCPQQFYIISGS